MDEEYERAWAGGAAPEAACGNDGPVDFPWAVDEEGFPITPGVQIEETLKHKSHCVFLFCEK